MLFTVYLQDTNGHRRLVGESIDISENDAKLVISNIEASHTKPHKVDYHMVGYTKDTKAAVLREKQIEGFYHH